MRKAYRVDSARLDREMREQKMTATFLAKAAGHGDHSYVARMRRGEQRARSVTKETAVAISAVLRLPVDYLFTEVDPRTGRPLLRDSQPLGLERAG